MLPSWKYLLTISHLYLSSGWKFPTLKLLFSSASQGLSARRINRLYLSGSLVWWCLFGGAMQCFAAESDFYVALSRVCPYMIHDWAHFSPASMSKEKRSGGTVDWPPKFQSTNLVGPFWLVAGQWNFHFMYWKFSQHNIKGTYHKWPVYSSSTQLFFLLSKFWQSDYYIDGFESWNTTTGKSLPSSLLCYFSSTI